MGATDTTKTGGSRSRKPQTGVSKHTEQPVMVALAKVNNKLQMLSVIFGAAFRTHGETKLSNINLHKAVNVAMLISILGQLRSKERDYNEAGDALKLPTFPVFMWEGYTLEAWQHDVQLRISQITQAESEAQLKELQKELTTLMTNEDKLAILMAKIEKLG